jgi:VWFA-related protein
MKSNLRPFVMPLLVVGLVTAALGRGVRVQNTQAPVFRSDVELVAVDVIAVDRNGKPIVGIRPEEFQVTIDGKARRVVSAQYVEQRQAASGTAVNLGRLEGEEAVEAAYASNEGPGPAASASLPVPRSIIIAIDQSTFSPTASRGLIAAATGLLGALNPLDRVGLMTFPTPGSLIAPSVNHSRVREGIANVIGMAEAPPRIQTGITLAEALAVERGDAGELGRVVDRVCAGASGAAMLDGRPSQAETCRQQIQMDVPQYVEYARRGSTVSLQELANVMRLLAVVPGPKTIVLISAGLVAGEHVSALGTLDEVKSIAALAATAQASLYVIHTDSSFFDANSLERQRVTGFALGESELRLAGLQHIATMAGGPVFRLSANSSTAFARVASELAGYYLLGVESQPADRDGAAHPIRVRVSRPDVSVRAREQVLVPRARAARTGDGAVLDALKSAGIERDLPVRLSTQVLRDPASDRVRVVLSANIGRGVRSPSTVRVAYSLRSSAGKVEQSGVESRRLSLIGTGDDATLSFVETVLLTPSRYTVRLVAADATGRLGSVEHQVTAGLVAGDGAMLSDLVLVDPSRVADSGLSPLADGRIWSDRVDAYLEIYPQTRKHFSTVTLAVADRPDGAPLVSFNTTAKEVDAGRRWTAQGGVDLSALPPGAYTLVARVFDGERPVATVSRPFRFEGMIASISRGGPRLPFSMAAAGSLVHRFRREDALRPEAIGYFLGRLQAADTQAASPDLAQAAEAMESGQYDAVLSQLAAGGEPQLAPAFLRGLALFAKGDLEPAATEFRLALRASNEFLPAAFYLGACYAAGGRDREAVGAWQTSLITESESRIVYDVLADGWLRLNNGAQAESILREAIGRWPADDSFVPRLAASLAIQQRRADALNTLAPYLDRRPDDGEALFLGMRLLYDAHAEGKAIRTGPEDAALATKYAALYKEARGLNTALVDRWAAFVRQKGGAGK